MIKKENIKLINIGCIQQYLPPNHPDLIVKEIIPEYVEYIDTKYKGQIVKVEEWTSHNFCCIRFENGKREQPFKHLVKSSTKEAYEAQNKPKQLNGNNLLPNEIYVTDEPTNYIFKTSGTGRGYSNYIYQFNSYNNITPSKDYIWTGNLRLATSEEKKWLNTCISQDKFIPKEDLHLYDDSGLLVKKEEIMFKKDDYIIPFKHSGGGIYNNYCFKQREYEEYLKPILDCHNSKHNGHKGIKCKDNSNWRYATSEEIAEYERIGKPFDVTTLAKTNEKVKSLLEEAKERYPIGTKFKCVKDSELAIVEQELKEDDQGFIYTKFQGNRFHQFVYAYDKWAEIVSLPNEIPIISDCITYNVENISKGFEVSSYYEFDGKSFNQDIYIPSITKKPKKLQTITIESTTDLNLGLTKIKSKQIQTIKI